jgi:ABC-type branched-subunit amino acid transport system ATPase component/branched-subunit amino acid ABC-type transport system permease component
LLLLGLASGALFALPALGLVLVYRSSGVVNFAQGAVGMAGGFVFWDLTVNAGWPPVAAACAGVLVGAGLGLATYVATMVLPKGGSTLTQVVATLGVLLILESGAELHYGQFPLLVKPFLPTGRVDFGGGIAVGADRLLLVVIAASLALGLEVFYRRTLFGVATTAVSERPRTLAALGWPIGRLRAGNWAIGGALAGLSGVLIAPIAGAAASNALFLLVGMLAAALIGSLRSFPLTLAGGLVVGVLMVELGQYDFGVHGIADAVPLFAIIGVLMLRGRALPLRSFVGERLPKVGSGRIRVGWLLVGAAILAGLLGVLNDNGTAALTTTLLAGIVLLSLTVVLGYGGQLSLAQMTLAGVGALIAAKLAGQAHLPFPAVLVLATLGTVPVGLLVGLPAARTRGVSLAIATLGLAAAIEALIFENISIAGGTYGVPLSSDGTFRIFGVDFDTLFHADRFAYLVLAATVVVAVAVANLRRGRAGRRIVAVRANERAAAALGINVVSTKLWAFAIGAAIAGLAGTLLAYRYPTALFGQYDVFSNVTAVGFAVIGGVGSPFGALLGGQLYPAGIGSAVADTVIGASAQTMALIGGILLLFTIVFSPDGIVVAAAQGITTARRRISASMSATAARFPRLHRATIEQKVRSAVVAGATSHRVAPASLEVSDLCVRFGGVRAVDGVDFHVAPGEVVGLIGPNGAGKTTVIDAITGFVRSTGSVALGGRALSARAPHARARAGLARSWQSLELFEDLSVLDNLRAAVDPRDARSYIVDLVRPERGRPTAAMVAAIRAFELAPLLGETPSHLSAGHRKLVALARAISSEPSVILLDEPCAGLDADERDEVGPVIRSLAADWGMGVLLVEHDVQLVRRVCDRAVVLDFGAVIAEGTPGEVLEDERVMAAFLGEAPQHAAIGVRL